MSALHRGSYARRVGMWVLVTMTGWVAGSSRLHADVDTKTVKVEFLKGQTKITPGDPTINLAASPSIILEVLPGDATFSLEPLFLNLPTVAKRHLKELSGLGLNLDSLRMVIQDPSQTNVQAAEASLRAMDSNPDVKAKAIRAAEDLKSTAETQPTTLTASANRFLVNFHRGWWLEYSSGPNRAVWDENCAKRDNKGKCIEHDDFVQQAGNSGLDVYLTNRTHPDTFRLLIKCTKNCDKIEPTERLLVIYIDTASFAPALSAGVMFPQLRDERYAANEQQELVRLPDGSIPYYAATFLHYCPINGVPVLDALCPTLSVATQVPVDGVVVGMGLGARIKPIETVNAGYFNVGVAYGPHKVLSDTYRGKTGPVTLPTGTKIEDITSTRYAFKFFAGVSIGIADGIDKFRGVFPGSKNKDNSKVEPASGNAK